jgi:vanillate O-demethylase monooxygenase subunit
MTTTHHTTNHTDTAPRMARQHWYVAATVDEVGRVPLGRTICGRHVVLFRREDGSAVALDDRCPHRGYPLSVGALVGDEIQCGYHGLRFDGCGTCVWAPGQDRVPSRANVRALPLIERGPWVWLWAGDPDTADASRLPAMAWLDDPGWATVHGVEPLAARASLLIDNLLDLSHETFLHAGYIGTPEVADTPITTRVDGNVVHVSRHMSAVECPPFYSNTTGLSTPIDRWQDIEYHAPGCYLLHVRVAPAGSEPTADGVDPDAAHVEVMYAITPVDEHRTLDFWAVSRDFAIGDADVDAYMATMNREVVLQDVEALSMIEQRLGDDWSPPEVSLKIDTGGLAARRVIADLVAAES